ncbi:MAG: hypothetical protein LJE70_03105 [Chromatiaceae bacterium]|jgi:hypothetical protein|nr:hypothetical protein [Chromatiaceae bacterium]
MADAVSANAEELIAKAKGYIESKDTELAAEAMERLRELRNTLPQSMQEKIDQLEGMLTAAKSGAEQSPSR